MTIITKIISLMLSVFSFFSLPVNTSKEVTKLVPVSGSAAMIERAGVVETYNTDLTELPYGVTETKAPVTDAYGDYTSSDYANWFVYGLDEGVTAGKLSNFITVTNGSFKVYKDESELTPESKAGTGTVIKVYNTEGEFVESFTVIIYGDLDGKSNINGTDRSIIFAELKSPSWGDKASDEYKPCMFRAADIDQNGYINETDYSAFTSVIEYSKCLNQITGYAEVK